MKATLATFEFTHQGKNILVFFEGDIVRVAVGNGDVMREEDIQSRFDNTKKQYKACVTHARALAKLAVGSPRRKQPEFPPPDQLRVFSPE